MERLTSFYSSFVPKENIYYEMNFNVVKKILDEQQKSYAKDPKKICVVMDDCLIDEVKRNYILNDLLLNGRHFTPFHI